MPGETPRPHSLRALAARAAEAIEHAVATSDTRGLPPWRAALLRTARVSYRAVVGFSVDGCGLRAAALTYVTVLSLVPFLAFAFALAKGFGAYQHLYTNVIGPFLDRTFGTLEQPLSGNAAELRAMFDSVLGSVERTSVTEIGPIALAVLAWAALKLLSSVEATFNVVFGVRRQRSLVRKLADYFAILTIAPALVIVATGITAVDQVRSSFAWIETNVLRGPLGGQVLHAAPVVGLWLGFAFLYACLPNTRVRLRSAVIGGMVAGALWQVAQILHMEFQVGLASYNKIYAGFGAIPIFLAWLFAAWSVTLFGAEVAAACEADAASIPTTKGAAELSPAERESLGLAAALIVAERFERGRGAIGTADLARDLGRPAAVLAPLLARLTSARVLIESAEESEPRFSLGRPARAIHVADVLRALRGGRAERRARDERGSAASAAIDALETEIERLPANRTLADLLPRAEGEAAPRVEAAAAGRLLPR